MQSFQLFVEDDRYVVPTLVLIEVESVEGARARADDLLSQSAHHLSVDVCQDGKSLFLMPAPRTPTPSSADRVHGERVAPSSSLR